MSVDEETFEIADYVGSPKELECLAELRTWVEREAEFYGRKDDEFLLIFIRGCKYNLEKAQKKLNKFYNNRRKIPIWWANRNLEDEHLRSLMNLCAVTPVVSKKLKDPLICIVHLNRIGNCQSDFDNYIKLASLTFEVLMRRNDFQLNGIIWIFDFKEAKTWIIKRLLHPLRAKDFVFGFYLAIPARIKSIIGLNCSSLTYAFYKLVKPLISIKLKKRVHLYKTGWSNVSNHIPVEFLPLEYGGEAETLEQLQGINSFEYDLCLSGRVS
ncbi:hypothetical protein CHUAL_003913 [Chamberlinius hualienensis]